MLRTKPSDPTDSPAPLFAALGDSTRLRLVDRLGAGDSGSITQLCAGIGLSRQGVTKHLRVLEVAGIVESTRVGRELHFALKPEALTPMQEYLRLVSRQWDDAIARLQAYVESTND